MLFYQKKEISHSDDNLLEPKLKPLISTMREGTARKTQKICSLQMHAVLPTEIMPTASIIVQLSLLPEMWAGYQKATEEELY